MHTVIIIYMIVITILLWIGTSDKPVLLTRFPATRLCPLCVPIRITSPVRISLNNTRDSRHPDRLSLAANQCTHNNIILLQNRMRILLCR